MLTYHHVSSSFISYCIINIITVVVTKPFLIVVVAVVKSYLSVLKVVIRRSSFFVALSVMVGGPGWVRKGLKLGKGEEWSVRCIYYGNGWLLNIIVKGYYVYCYPLLSPPASEMKNGWIYQRISEERC